jgi:hypothetical protein
VEDDPGERQKTVTQRDEEVTQPTPTQSSPEPEEDQSCLPNSRVGRSTALAKSTVSSAKAQSERVGKITHQQLNFPVTRSVQMLRKKLSSSHQAKPDDGVKKRLTQRRLTTTRYTAGLRGTDPKQLCPAGLSNCVSGHCSHPRSVYWVQCGRCDLWYHCRCVEIPPQKAKQPDFSCL